MNVRTRRIAVTVAVLAVAVTPAAFSKPAAQPANYVLQVDFGVGYEVTGSYLEGDRTAECTGWKETKVRYEVSAKSGPRPPSRVYTIRGLFTNYAVLPKKARDLIIKAGGLGWGAYDFSAVGVAHGTVYRQRVETGEDKTCGTGTPVVTPLRPPPNDCGTRSFTTRTATLKAGFRGLDGTLEGIETEALRGELKGLRLPAIVFSVAPAQSLYRSCDVNPGGAAEFPIGMGLVPLLDPKKENASTGLARRLVSMKVGDIRRFAREYDGKCDDDLKPPARCTFSLELNVRIKRTH